MFLEQVIEDYLENYADTPTGEVIFITPHRRSALFLRKIFSEKVHKAAISPEFITLDNLLERISGIKKMPDLQGLFELYKVYKEHTESEVDDFEKFVGWGRMLWKDFSDIDQYLIAYKDIFPYMEAIKEAEHWSVGEELTPMQQRHLEFWRTLGTYYNAIHKVMYQQKQGYQGFIARIAYEQIDAYRQTNKEKLHLFVGFNALSVAQEKIIQYILEEMQADIYWDIEKHFLNNQHSAGYFIENYLKRWKYYQRERKPKWITEEKTLPEIKIYGTPKQVNQIHLLTTLLDEIPEEEWEQTAIVLSDSDMLLPLLQAIDTNKLPINITMGYPLQQTPVNDLISAYFKLYISGRWYHKEIKALLEQPFLSNLLSENYKKDTITYINEHNFSYVYKKILDLYVKEEDRELINLLFDDEKDISVSKLIGNVIKLLFVIKESLEKSDKENVLNLEYIYNFYELFNQIHYLQKKYNYIDSVKSLYYIYNDLLVKQKLSFRGEPLRGLQIMGVLEAQNIHFKNVLITSMNEGIFPKGNAVNSLIPFDVRANLGLPTYKESDYMYSYYFYRILQHTHRAILLYNTDTDGLRGSERSRFVLQLLSDYRIRPQVKFPEVKIIKQNQIKIAKDKNIIEKLVAIATKIDPKHRKGFSPSSLTTYVRNPIDFYQQQILDIRDEAEVEEIVEDRSLGTIIHRILELLYTPYVNSIISKKNIDEIRKKVRETTEIVFKEYQQNDEISGKNIFVQQTIEEYVMKFLAIDEKNVSENVVTLLSVEQKIQIDIKFDEFPFPICFNGTIDRVERRGNDIYIVDYKSGIVDKEDVKLSDKGWENLILDYKYSKAFQLLMYAYLLFKMGIIQDTDNVYVGNYSFRRLKLGFIGFRNQKDKEISLVDSQVREEFEQKLIQLLKEIYDPELPFVEK